MFTVNINDSRIKQDELLRQAADYRVIRTQSKLHRTPTPLARILRSLVTGLAIH